MYKFALGCGPTGGHLIPALLVGREIENRGHRAVLFSSASPDNQLLKKSEISYQTVDMEGWQGGVFKRFRVLAKTLLEVFRLRKPLAEFDAVVVFGGYSTVPLFLAAVSRRIPVFVQEQNRVLGRASRLAGHFAEWCFYGLPPRRVYFENKASLVGNPVRRCRPVDEGWFADNRLLMVIGGSQGARSLSRELEKSVPDLLEEDWHIYYIRGHFGRDLSQFETEEKFRQVDFELDLPRYLAAADCVWARSGAGTITEIIHYNIPALLFPYREAADNHQYLNAKWLAARGPARLVKSEITSRQLVEQTEQLARRDDKYSVPWSDELPAEKMIVDKITAVMEN